VPIFVSKVGLFFPFMPHLSVEIVIVSFVVEGTCLPGLASVVGVRELTEKEVSERPETLSLADSTNLEVGSLSTS